MTPPEHPPDDARSGLLERHLAFVEALRGAGLSVSLAEDLDAVAALGLVSWADRAVVRDAFAATLVKRSVERPTFDALFDLYFPALVGGGVREPAGADADEEGEGPPADDGQALADVRDRLVEALAAGDERALDRLATDAVGRFGAMPGRGPGLSSWSAYTTLRRLAPQELTDRIVAALLAGGSVRDEDEAARSADRGVGGFTRRVEDDARRRIAEEKGPDHVAEVAVRPSIDRLPIMAARKADLDEMRREIYPLARRLATRLARERRSQRRGPLDVRRTVRASIATGGVPLVTHHRPRRPHRTDLVVLCDVSGSVASFATFTLLLVCALQEQFPSMRAFTFVDRVHEVTDLLSPGADPGEVLAALAASTQHAARFGRTSYGRAFTQFSRDHGDVLGPRSTLLVLGDARSNHGDLAVDALRGLVSGTRGAWWLNPEHRRQWDTGDSAASAYGAVVPMTECRTLGQLAEFVHDLAV